MSNSIATTPPIFNLSESQQSVLKQVQESIRIRHARKVDQFCDDARFCCYKLNSESYPFSALVATLDSLKSAASLVVGDTVSVSMPWGFYDSLQFSVLSIDWDILTLCESKTGRVVECPASYCSRVAPRVRGLAPSAQAATVPVL